MPAPQVDYSDREERLQYIQERYKCMAPHCGYCGKCGMPDGLVPEEVFADFIETSQPLISRQQSIGKQNMEEIISAR